MSVWLGYCHLTPKEGEAPEEYDAVAAVFCESVEGFRARLQRFADRRGYRLLWTEEVHPAGVWVARHPKEHGAAALARAVHQGNVVELGPLRATGPQSADGAERDQTYLIVEEVEGIEPLDAQRGVWPAKNVPDILVEPLFGRVEPTEAEIVHYGCADAVPPMKTYAILDAGKFQSGLSEIEECEMPFRCLFKGDAAEELKDVAPYLIELDPESRFTRRLFTWIPEIPDAMTTVHLWHKEPGIYIRSRSDFATLWKHFRKFTRVQNETGAWYYFQFWEPKAALAIFRMLATDQKEVPGILHPKDNPPLFSALSRTGSVLSIIKPVSTLDDSTRVPFVLTKDQFDCMNRLYGTRFEREFAQKLFDVSPHHRQWLGVNRVQPVEQLVHTVSDGAKKMGCKAKNEVTKLASFAYFAGTHALNDPRIAPLKQRILLSDEHQPIRRIQLFEEALEESNLNEILLSNESLLLAGEALPKVSQGGEAALIELLNAHPHLLRRDAQGDFFEACRDQCQKWRLVSEAAIYAHAICALVFTPFFMDDPLHGALRTLFTEGKSGELVSTIVTEFERRLAA